MNVLERDHIFRYLSKDPYAHLFHLADLDEPYAADIQWFIRKKINKITSLALLFLKPELPVFQLLDKGNPDASRLLEEILPQLPDKLFCHLTDDLPELLSASYKIESRFPFFRMIWRKENVDRIVSIDKPQLVHLTDEHAQAVREFIPAVWFDTVMLKYGYYYGFFDQGHLVSVVGTAVFSKKYGVAVIGSVGTRESHQRRGLATLLISKLLTELAHQVPYIGLNVRADNKPAIGCYSKLGFEIHSEFWECRFSK